MDIFCYFDFCHCRRNAFRIFKLTSAYILKVPPNCVNWISCKTLFMKMNGLCEPLSISIPLCIKVDDDDQYCSTAGSAGKMSKKISSHCVDWWLSWVFSFWKKWAGLWGKKFPGKLFDPKHYAWLGLNSRK